MASDTGCCVRGTAIRTTLGSEQRASYGGVAWTAPRAGASIFDAPPHRVRSDDDGRAAAPGRGGGTHRGIGGDDGQSSPGAEQSSLRPNVGVAGHAQDAVRAQLLCAPSPVAASSAASDRRCVWAVRRSEWFFDEKFYIFIHWGIFSVPAYAPIGQAAEWYLQYLLAGEPKIAAFQEKNYGNNATVESYKASSLRARAFAPDAV